MDLKMKTTHICTFLLAATICSAQKFSTHLSLGLGDNIEQMFPYYEKKDRGRITLSVAEYLELNSKYAIGVEGNISGRLFSFLGGSNLSFYEEISTNTRWLNNNNMPATTLLIIGKYFVLTQNKVKPFIGLGLGTNTYSSRIHINDIAKVSKTSFVFSPKAGFDISRIRVECQAILGGKTPLFDGLDADSNQRVVLTSISSTQIYLNIGYRLFGEYKNK